MSPAPGAGEIAAVIHDLRRLSDRDPDAIAHRDQILAAKRDLLARLDTSNDHTGSPPAQTPTPPTQTTTPTLPTCARPDCDQPIARNPRGRPAIYCSPPCRPSSQRRRPRLTVDIAHPETSPDGRPADRVWTVTLRRGPRAVTIAHGLGWPSAHALARQLNDLLHGPVHPQGGAIG